ncbi:MAG: VWA domain-containing protein [Pseudomonadota bacterium]
MTRFTGRPLGYPFAALVGQEDMKKALLLLAVDPDLGGVLLVGRKGTAKSTAVRALEEILPPLDAVEGCLFHCRPDSRNDLCPDCRRKVENGAARRGRAAPPPFLTIPLGATEDRLVGGLDLEPTAATGRPHLAVGLLGQANRGFLYVDEVNLLEPYLAHLLLDAASSGVLRVEREGLSMRLPSRAALIGTMNPEEGALGPQLADRFALAVRVEGEEDLGLRAEIVRRRLAFEKDPAGFRRSFGAETEKLKQGLARARERLPKTGLSAEAQAMIGGLVQSARPRGHRGDLALARAARALAAWEGISPAGPRQVLEVAELALASRKVEDQKKAIRVKTIVGGAAGEGRPQEAPIVMNRGEEPPLTAPTLDRTDPQLPTRLYLSNESFEIITPVSRREQGPRGRSGRRSARQVNSGRGRYFRSSPERLGRPVALDATFRAAAPHQASRRQGRGTGLVIRPPDLREKVYRQKTGRLVLFLVDASGSVGSFERMSEAKAAALSLLAEAYQKRDRVGLIAFHGREAKILLPPTNSVELAGKLLEDLPSGGKTPLAAALLCAQNLIRVELSRDPGLTPLVVLMTDGRPNIPLTPGVDPWREVLALAGRIAEDRRLRFLLVDTDRGYYNDYKLTKDLSERLRAPRLTLEDLRNGELAAWLEKAA